MFTAALLACLRDQPSPECEPEAKVPWRLRDRWATKDVSDLLRAVRERMQAGATGQVPWTSESRRVERVPLVTSAADVVVGEGPLGVSLGVLVQGLVDAGRRAQVRGLAGVHGCVQRRVHLSLLMRVLMASAPCHLGCGLHLLLLQPWLRVWCFFLCRLFL